MKNCWNIYELKTNVKDNLFRKVNKKDEINLKKVIWYERLFDVRHEVHISLAHSVYSRTHKIIIDKTWWGLPKTAIKRYIKLCPDCLRATPAPKSETMNPLKMIISDTIGSRAQIDLIDYRRKEWKATSGCYAMSIT